MPAQPEIESEYVPTWYGYQVKTDDGITAPAIANDCLYIEKQFQATVLANVTKEVFFIYFGLNGTGVARNYIVELNSTCTSALGSKTQYQVTRINLVAEVGGSVPNLGRISQVSEGDDPSPTLTVSIGGTPGVGNPYRFRLTCLTTVDSVITGTVTLTGNV